MENPKLIEWSYNSAHRRIRYWQRFRQLHATGYTPLQEGLALARRLIKRNTNLDLDLCRVAFALILITTAIPEGFRAPKFLRTSFVYRPADAILNVALYLPLGLFLQPRAGLLRIAVLSTALSGSVEFAQSFFIHRLSESMDILCNVFGSLLGSLIGRRMGIRSSRVRLGAAVGIGCLAVAALWVVACPSLSSDFKPWLVDYARFRDKDTGAGDILNGMVQLAFDICTAGIRTNAAFTGFLAAAGIISFIPTARRSLLAAVGAIAGAVAAGLLVPAMGRSPFEMAAIGAISGLAFSLCMSERRELRKRLDIR